MDVMFGFVIFLAGLFFGGLSVIVVFARAGLNRQNVEWLQQIEMVHRRRASGAERERLVQEIAAAMADDRHSQRFHE